MEKNIKKRVRSLALVLSAVLVVLFGYWFLLVLLEPSWLLAEAEGGREE